VEIPLIYSDVPVGGAEKMIEDAVHSVGFDEKLHVETGKLSGGQKQRIAIARALVTEPSIIFADEPTGNLDSKSGAQVMGILDDLNKKGHTVILVTHETYTAEFADRIIRLKDGRHRERCARSQNPATRKTNSSNKKEKFHARQRFSSIRLSTACKHGKMRSLLTMLGIVIGIASVIILMSIGAIRTGLYSGAGPGHRLESDHHHSGRHEQRPFLSRPRGAGHRHHEPGPAGCRTLSQQDPSVAAVTEEDRGQATASFEDNNETITFDGVPANFFTVRNFNVAEGYPFTDSDVQALNHVAVIGPTLAATLFGAGIGSDRAIHRGQEHPVPHRRRARERRHRRVRRRPGQYRDRAHHRRADADARYHLLQRHHGAGEPELQYQLRAQQRVERYWSRITASPIRTRRLYDRDAADVLSLLGSITSILTLFLAAIASISLVVGGIGIMNIMLVSVIERTREIGLRKSVGATNNDILQQFLVESVMLTFIGGVIGIALGGICGRTVGLSSQHCQRGMGVRIPDLGHPPRRRRFERYRHCVRHLSRPPGGAKEPDRSAQIRVALALCRPPD
jgi:macrolide transport system ATP-binding/permease protein